MMASRTLPETESNQPETLLVFPCKFPVKAMGRNGDGFEALVTKIILAHADLYIGEPITTNPSGAGNFISVTVTIEAQSKNQLDRIYQDLTDCEQVLVAL
jgi:putative lipoic acid-binding regulatory protein